MGAPEKSHQRELMAAHQRRLDYLELQEAAQGYATPAEVRTEMDQIRAAIARLRDAIDEPLPPATVAALSPDDRYQGHVAWQMRLEETIYQFRRELREMRHMVYVLCAAVLIIGTAVAFR